MNSLQYKDLLINFTTEFVPVWNDKGTRAEKPVTFWRPSTSSDALGNFVPLGDVAVAGYHNINQLNIVAVVSEVDRENGTALRPPVDFERVLGTLGTKGTRQFLNLAAHRSRRLCGDGAGLWPR